MLQQMMLAVIPLIVLIATGYGLKQVNFFEDGFWHGAEKLNYYLLFPALLLHTTLTAHIEFSQLKRPILSMFVVVASASTFLYALRMFKPMSAARFGVHMQSVVRFNTYIGLALVAALYAKQGMAILAVLLALCIPVVNVISVLSLMERQHMALRPVLLSLLKNPLILSCAVGISLNLLNVPIWQGILQVLKISAASSLPLGLFCVGAALQFKQLHKDLWALSLDTFARLLLMPALAYTVANHFAVPQLSLQVMVIFFALPTASASYILTKVLNGDSQLMAAVISFQTVCAALTLPLVIWCMT